MTPTSATIVANAFSLRERGRAVAIYNGIGMIFLALGPLLGGLLVEKVGWRWIFWINIPIGIVSLLLTRIGRPANRPTPGTISRSSLVLLVAGLAACVVGLQQGGVWGWASPTTLATLLAGLLAVAAFSRAQLHNVQPLINLRLFGIRTFRADCIVIGLLQFALMPIVVYAPLLLQNVLDMSPLAAGAALLPFIVSLALAAQVAGRRLDRSGVRMPVLTGMSTAAVGIAGWAASLSTASYAWQLPGMVVAGAGTGLSLSPSITDALSRTPVAERGQGSGLSQTVRQLGGAVGLAATSAIVIAVESDTYLSTPDAALPEIPATMAAFALAAVVAAAAAVTALVGLPRHERDPESLAFADDPPPIAASGG